MSKKTKRNRKPVQAESQRSGAVGRPLKILGASALTVIVGLLAFGGSLQLGLTGLDDDVFVGTFAKQQYSITDALHRDAFMSENSDNFYRPLQSIAFIASAYFWGNNPKSYHSASVILHCIAVCCLLWLLLLLGYRLILSLIAALIYAAHPLFAQAVAWIPGCGDLLLGLFGILSFFTLVKFCTAQKWRYLGLHGFAFMLAALSKETAVLMPVIFAAYLVLTERKKALSFRNLCLAAVWLIVVDAWYLLRSTAITRLPNRNIFGIGALMENLRVVPETLGGFFFPFNISVMPSFSLLWTAIGLAVMAGLVAIVWLQGKQRRPLVIIGGLWFILLSIPGMMYSQQFGKFAYNYLNHRAYLPLIGILLILIEAVPDAWLTRRKKEFYLTGAGLAVLLGILAYYQTEHFVEPQAFYSQAIRTNPQSALAYNHRGKYKADARQFQSALDDYNMALRLYPNYPLAYNNRAETRGALEDTQGAIEDLTKAMAFDPENAVLYSNRGRWYDKLGKMDAALADYNRGIQLNPKFAGNYNNRGALKVKMNDLEGAKSDFEAAIKCEPTMSDPILNHGQVLMRLGDQAGACNEWLRASQLGNWTARQLFQQACH
jgi:protein O-mannosyl-transferase